MLRKYLLAGLAALTGLMSPALMAEPTPVAKKEITHLLDYLEKSQCEFNRNGSWYSSKDASKHLSDKYDYLLKKDWVSNSESFIDRAATKSSISGKDYQVRCPGEQAVTSAVWLTAELTRWRQTQDKSK